MLIGSIIGRENNAVYTAEIKCVCKWEVKVCDCTGAWKRRRSVGVYCKHTKQQRVGSSTSG